MENLQFLNGLPGYRVNEYLLVLSPPEELGDRLAALREGFAEKYRVSSRPAKPAIPLVSFTQREMMEERIRARLRLVAMGFPPFPVQLKDFGSFPSHTIFINVASKTALQQLVREIRREAQRLMKFDEDRQPHFFLEPHITLASRLKPWQYEKGWLEYSRKHVRGKFIASSMALLKKPEGDAHFHLVDRLEFQNLPIVTKQGALF